MIIYAVEDIPAATGTARPSAPCVVRIEGRSRTVMASCVDSKTADEIAAVFMLRETHPIIWRRIRHLIDGITDATQLRISGT